MRHATSTGTPFAMLPSQAGPALLLFATTAEGTLTHDLYGRVGRHLHARGWNVISLDVPCHGADARAGEPPELAGWAARVAAGEDLVAAWQARVRDVVAHLAATGITRFAAAGTSRGGYAALQAAASEPRIAAVAGFAPVTRLTALREFAGVDAARFDAHQAVPALAGRPVWLTIGAADDRVGTDHAIAFARALTAAGSAVSLHVLPTPGHCSEPAWHDAAAAWLAEVLP
jgi:predicted esterase